jgi:hypothetical protein
VSVWIKISTSSLLFDLRRDTGLIYYTESRRHRRKCAHTERNDQRRSHEPGPPAVQDLRAEAKAGAPLLPRKVTESIQRTRRRKLEISRPVFMPGMP